MPTLFVRPIPSSAVPRGNRGEVGAVVEKHLDGFYDSFYVLFGTGPPHARLTGGICELSGKV